MELCVILRSRCWLGTIPHVHSSKSKEMPYIVYMYACTLRNYGFADHAGRAPLHVAMSLYKLKASVTCTLLN